MTRKELIAKIAEQAGLSPADADSALSAFQEIACQVVADGNEKLTIPGFLTFEQGARSAREGRNPRTGAAIHIAAAKTAKVTVGSKLKEAAAG
jgi:DNA-binding protein HU-beta